MAGEFAVNELMALESIKHSSIPQILDKGDNYYTTTLIEGKTLDQLPLPYDNWRSLACGRPGRIARAPR